MDILQQRDKRLQDVRSQHTSFLIEDILFRPKPTLPQVRYKRITFHSLILREEHKMISLCGIYCQFPG